MAAWIRPVTTKWPASSATLNECQLPLSVVLQSPSSGVDETPLPLSSLPKCRHCGAPHSDAVELLAPGSSRINGARELMCLYCHRVNTTLSPDMPGSLFELPLRRPTTRLLWCVVLETEANWAQVKDALESLKIEHVDVLVLWPSLKTKKIDGEEILFQFVHVLDLASTHVPHVRRYLVDPEQEDELLGVLREHAVPVKCLNLPKVLPTEIEQATVSDEFCSDLLGLLSTFTESYAGGSVTWIRSGEAKTPTIHGGRIHIEGRPSRWDPDVEDPTPLPPPPPSSWKSAAARVGLGVHVIAFHAPARLVLAAHHVVQIDKDLAKHIRISTPWQPHTVFGAELRVRLSPGWGIAAEPTEDDWKNCYCRSGMVGSVDQDTHDLWHVATMNPSTALTLDLQCMTSPETVNLTGYGTVSVLPVIQVCWAYTTLVNGKAVRRLRIASRQVPATRNVEEIYDTLDPEVLATVLFHKVVLATTFSGLETAAAEIGDTWLQKMLVCAYRSAETQETADQESAEKGLPKSERPLFLAQERLLDRAGELSVEDVLLGSGHALLAAIPLIVFLLQQCDALRPQSNTPYRLVALSQLHTMAPANLARVLAPRIQLWDPKEEEPIVEVVNLSSTAVQNTCMEHLSNKSGNAVLLVDAPDQIWVLNARHVHNPTTSSWSIRRKSKSTVQLGNSIKLAIQEAADSYRVPPTVQYTLDFNESDDDDTNLQALWRLADVLAEDAPSPSGDENYSVWRSRIAEGVNQSLVG